MPLVRVGAAGRGLRLGFIKIDLFYIFWYKNWSDIHIFAGLFDERFL